MRHLVVFALLATLSACLGFQTRGSSTFHRPAAIRPTARQAVPPESFQDAHSFLVDSAHAWSYLLADAAQATLDTSAVVDATVEAAKDEGWWKAYLNIFKSALLLVHNTVDEPLRNVGITQTWGISIAIFTACKFLWASPQARVQGL